MKILRIYEGAEELQTKSQVSRCSKFTVCGVKMHKDPINSICSLGHSFISEMGSDFLSKQEHRIFHMDFSCIFSYCNTIFSAVILYSVPKTH